MIPRKEMRACRRAAENELCRVCLEKAHGFHFGILSCRACAAFFRRTVALNMVYHCRFDNKCQIDKSIRCMCRSCRHAKCLDVGMKAEQVQLNRDAIGKMTKELKNATLDEFPKSPESNSPPNLPDVVSNNKAVDDAETELFNHVNGIFEHAASFPQTSANLNSLQVFQMALEHLRQRRLEVHTEVLPELEPFYGTDEFDVAMRQNWEMVVGMAEKELALYGEVLSFIQPLVQLPADQRWLLFKSFSIAFMRFERAYETYRILGSNRDDMRTVTFNGQSINFMSAVQHETPRLKQKLEYELILKIFRPAKFLVQKGLINPIRELELSETEFSALCLHLLWLHPGSEAVTESTQRIINQCRRQTFVDLHNYYVHSIGMTAYSTRMGDFMALMSALEKSVFQKRENILIADLFAVAKMNPTIVSLTR